MIRLKPAPTRPIAVSEPDLDHDESLVVVDDMMFVNEFACGAHARGRAIVCVGCFDPSRPLRAFVFRLEAPDIIDESAGSLGFCFDCYRDLMERVFHGAKAPAN